MSCAPHEGFGAEGTWKPRNLSNTENEETPSPKRGSRKAGYSWGKDEGKGTSSHNPNSPHLLGQKSASAERKNEDQIFKLKGMREGAKEEAGTGTPGLEGGRDLGIWILGLRDEGVGRAEGLDLRSKGLGTGTLGLWKEGSGVWDSHLPSPSFWK